MIDKLYHIGCKSLLKGLIYTLSAIILVGCGTTTKIIEDHREAIIFRDSTIYHFKDSIVLIPIERVVDIVPAYDTLILETSLAKSTAYVDTSLHILKGSIENKEGAIFQLKVVEKEKVVEVRDTLYQKETIEVPVEVVKYKRGKFFYFLLGYFILSLLSIGIYIYFKLKV